VGNPFADATTVRALGGGRYRGELDDTWNLRPLPQGGVLSAAAVRAMEAELNHPDQLPRTLHTTFVGQVSHGELDIDVEVLRRGRSMSQLRAQVRNPGSAHGHVTSCVFGSERKGFSFTDLTPPQEIPDPRDCPSFRDPPPEGIETPRQHPFFAKRLEGRAVLGHPPWVEYVPDRAETAVWNRFDDPPVLDDGELDPLALIVIADTMPGAVGEKLGHQKRTWFAPSIDLTVHLLDKWRSPWVLAHNRARYAGHGYASADIALWDCGENASSTPRLIAYATQLFLFSFVE